MKNILLPLSITLNLCGSLQKSLHIFARNIFYAKFRKEKSTQSNAKEHPLLRSNNTFKQIILLLILFLILYSCKITRFFVYNFADIKDYKKFPCRTIENQAPVFEFKQLNTLSLTNTRGCQVLTPDITMNRKTYNLDSLLAKNSTVAFLVIKNDTIYYEKYFNHYNDTSIVPSFSMAKSFISALVGIAISEGYIKSVNQPITDYLPQLKARGVEQVTIKHLLQMTSGIKFKENYNSPFSDVASLYYGRNLRKSIDKIELEEPAGTRFHYNSINPQLLGFILEEATHKTISVYMEEKLWKPLGMEYDGTWSLDKSKDGVEKAYCCINARARDFAKFGRLYLNYGEWDGVQIIPKDWVKESIKIDTSDGSFRYYQYLWWLCSEDAHDYMAQGLLGQFIYVNNLKKIIIVRLGKKEGEIDWVKLFKSISEQY